jgi:hypothetical protein
MNSVMGGGFYFQKKPLQCVKTVAPFIIYYLYTFNNITAIRMELTLLLEGVHQGMQYDLTLPEEFEHAKIPEINIPGGVPKLPGQPGNHSCNFLREMQEACPAHLITCNVKVIPFLCVLIGYQGIKTHCPYLGQTCAHYQDGQLGFSERRLQPIHLDVARPHVLQHERDECRSLGCLRSQSIG